MQPDAPLDRPETLLAELVSCDGVRRVIRLGGWLDATVEYDGGGSGYETVRVDGKRAARVINWSVLRYTLVAHIDFVISGPHGAMPASIDVRAAGFERLAGLRLLVAGRQVYAEGVFAERTALELPIPSGPSGPDAGSLPLPACPVPNPPPPDEAEC